MLKECALRTCRAIGNERKKNLRIAGGVEYAHSMQTVFMEDRLEEWLDALLAQCHACFAAFSLNPHDITWRRSVPNVRVCRILAPATHHPMNRQTRRWLLARASASRITGRDSGAFSDSA